MVGTGLTIGVVEADGEQSCLVRIGGDADWIARYLASMEVPFEVLEPDDVKRELRALGRRRVRDHQHPAEGPDRAGPVPGTFATGCRLRGEKR